MVPTPQLTNRIQIAGDFRSSFTSQDGFASERMEKVLLVGTQLASFVTPIFRREN